MTMLALDISGSSQINAGIVTTVHHHYLTFANTGSDCAAISNDIMLMRSLASLARIDDRASSGALIVYAPSGRGGSRLLIRTSALSNGSLTTDRRISYVVIRL